MNNLNDFKIAILEQAKKESEQHFSIKKNQIEETFQIDKNKLIAKKEMECQMQLKEYERKFQIDAQKIKNEKRQLILKAKQTFLKNLFDSALDKLKAFSPQEELNFIISVLEKYEGQFIEIKLGSLTANKLSADDINFLSRKFPNTTLLETTSSNEAGFIISNGNVDNSYLYSDLIDSIFEEESSQIAKSVFLDK